MEKINHLIEIATQLQFSKQQKELSILKKRKEMPQQELLIPFVGEFSSGKTTLLNALMDSKKLETASKPTTATIFQIRFCAEKSKAIIHKEDGSMEEVENIEEFTNENVEDIAYVEVYDTSTRVPSTTLIIDTPGISSPEPKHIEVLTTFLPQSDAVILVSDINQQLTRTIMEFIKTTALVKKPLYLVLTKTDTKTTAEVEKAKEYAKSVLPDVMIACVDSLQGNIDEVDAIFQDIQKRKDEIVANAIEQRLTGIAKEMLDMINSLLDSTQKDKSIEQEIEAQENSLRQVNNAIDVLEREAIQELEEISKKLERKYFSEIESKLYSIAVNNSSNPDSEVQATVNGISVALLSNLKIEIRNLLVSISRSKKGVLEDINLDGIQQIDLSEISIGDVSYNINLNEAGHQYDGIISGVLKIAAVATAAGGAAMLARAGMGAAAVNTGSSAIKSVGVGTIADVVDTATDVASIHSNRKNRKFMGEFLKYKEKLPEAMQQVDKLEQDMKETLNTKKGIFDGIASWTAEKKMAKPARRRLINQYIHSTLLPHFSNSIKEVEYSVIEMTTEFLREQANAKTSQMTESLKELKEQENTNKEAYKKKVEKLKEYKQYLN